MNKRRKAHLESVSENIEKTPRKAAAKKPYSKTTGKASDQSLINRSSIGIKKN